MGTVVVGYVAKPEGEAALARALEEAALRSWSVLVVRSRRSAREDRGEEELAAVRERLAGTGLDHEVRDVVGLDAGEDLVTAAEEVAADLIVIGLRRRTPVGKLILGSSAQRVLLDAPCAVLTVRSA